MVSSSETYVRNEKKRTKITIHQLKPSAIAADEKSRPVSFRNGHAKVFSPFSAI
jgi:hypothetical protein